jgi:excisionase family DNA binding protein
MSLADMPDVLTVEEAAKVLRIGRTAAYSAARCGELPGVVRIGRTLRVSRHTLEQTLGLQNGDGPAVNGPDRETSTIAQQESDRVPSG